ncbi:gephyrin-like molybdotransferase Glp [Paradevosia shaoguanensis]|uniref:molybdopterin molybdotransferase MoeA n=1 Tax=Paradevosia shaoguanensis TaxID=1335043 RepID=UPI003C74E840
MSLLPVETALAKIFERIPAPQPEIVALPEANGRVLLEPLLARHNQPPFNASAMDGYAVRAEDFAEGASTSVRLVGTSQAGSAYSGTLNSGEAVRIFTGAPVPDGANCVMMQEVATVTEGRASFSELPKAGKSIRPMGYDFANGEALLAPGTRLTPYSLALAAAANAPTLTVARRPTISVLSTGDELVLPGTALAPSQIVASNAFGLVPLLSPFAQTVTDHGIARDDFSDLRGKLEAALEADIVVTSGGASVGDHDIVQDVLKDLGVEIDFWRINMRPGKPLMFGTRGKSLIFGLPGNPVSAMVTATVFLLPALRRWLGEDEPLGPRLVLPLAEPLPPNTARRHFQRATIETVGSGATRIRPISETDSGHTSSLARAHALIIQPENDPGQPAGALVEVIPL